MAGFPSLAESAGFVVMLGFFAAIGAALAAIDLLIRLPILGLALLGGGIWMLMPTFRAGFPVQGEATVGTGIALLWFCTLSGYGGLRWLKRGRRRA
jgi:hypothetical protein